MTLLNPNLKCALSSFESNPTVSKDAGRTVAMLIAKGVIHLKRSIGQQWLCAAIRTTLLERPFWEEQTFAARRMNSQTADLADFD